MPPTVKGSRLKTASQRCCMGETAVAVYALRHAECPFRQKVAMGKVSVAVGGGTGRSKPVHDV